jgi:hypothetical protein
MKNSNITDGDAFPHEVNIDLDMLRALMLNGVSGEIHGVDVVAVDQHPPCERVVELLK